MDRVDFYVRRYLAETVEEPLDVRRVDTRLVRIGDMAIRLDTYEANGPYLKGYIVYAFRLPDGIIIYDGEDGSWLTDMPAIYDDAGISVKLSDGRRIAIRPSGKICLLDESALRRLAEARRK